MGHPFSGVYSLRVGGGKAAGKNLNLNLRSILKQWAQTLHLHKMDAL